MTTDMLLTALENVKMNPSQNGLYINLLFSSIYNFLFYICSFWHVLCPTASTDAIENKVSKTQF